MSAAVDKVAMALVPRLIWSYLSFTVATSRLTVYGSEHPDRLVRDPGGFIYAFWHSRQILLPVLRRDESVHCLVSSSRDGEYVARVARLFGKSAIRGSTTRGGFEAMRRMIRVLESGGTVAITPDGPKGPPNQVQPGVVQVSRALGVPVVPMAFDSSRRKVFASWDGFILPCPFSRIAVVFGAPVRIGQEETVEAGSVRLKRALDRVCAESRRLVNP